MAASAWTEVRVLVPAGWHELVADVVARPPCTSVIVGRTSIAAPAPPAGSEWVRSFLPAHADTPAARGVIEDALASLAGAAGEPELATIQVDFRALPPEDWATSWKKSWRPFRVGRIAVVPPWRDKPLRADDVRLVLQPGGAFGSGRHATTRACLRALDARIRGGERVLDAGMGSGILSVAATRLGAASALGFDTDEHAPHAARSLAEDNGVASHCTFRQGDFSVLEPGDTGFDVVLANIYSDVIRAHATDLAARLGAGGWFAFSGIPTHHASETRAAIEAAGLKIENERRCGRWHTYVGA